MHYSREVLIDIFCWLLEEAIKLIPSPLQTEQTDSRGYGKQDRFWVTSDRPSVNQANRKSMAAMGEERKGAPGCGCSNFPRPYTTSV